MQNPLSSTSCFSKPERLIDWQLCIQKVSGNKNLAKEFLGHFIEELRKNREEFTIFLSQDNLLGLEHSAHKLLGACCFFGIPSLQVQVASLEQQSKNPLHMDELKHQIASLIQKIDAVIDEFNTNFSSYT